MSDPQPALDPFARLCQIVGRLRRPDGCPWDREQTNETLLPPLIEEAYEVASAVRAGDDQNLCEELGDLILLTVMHTEIATETGRFDIQDVLNNVSEKLIRRHPHVFGTSNVQDAEGVVKQWEAIKEEEKNNANQHYLADLPMSFPRIAPGSESAEEGRPSQLRLGQHLGRHQQSGRRTRRDKDGDRLRQPCRDRGRNRRPAFRGR